MTEKLDDTPPARRRSDARRSIGAIVDAARTVLSERPDASMEEIATVAGVSRQTVYAHFPSRDALVAALLHAAGAEIVAAIDGTHLDDAPPAAALRQFLAVIWDLLGRYPLLLDSSLTRNAQADGDAAHQAAIARLEQLIRRGQREGDFDRALSPGWLAVAVLALIHAAAGQVAARHLTTSEAADMLAESTLRLCGAAGSGHAGAGEGG